ncbi:2-iminoacetate synthase ThiH [Opitutales bacterium ASA1]|uniref:2-iminoacetate synthase ThiH n=1 Tax=Congregicoccus parvus TaxID=3081749 RepID=UPI002B2FDDB6|nr:2-iminoacetate synthase ThiH [Opitutales bacterium ASA1]
MSMFSHVHPTIDFATLGDRARHASDADVRRILARGRAISLEDFAALLSPAASVHLEALCRLSRAATQKFFGKTIRLFAPIYLSNECVNICRYCGFSRNNDIPRITLPVDHVEREVRLLAARGFRSLLVVAGEHPKYVSNGYVETVLRRLLPIMPSLALELGPLETQDYVPMVRAGAEGLVVYQETYDEPTYRDLHTAGPKKHYAWRMDTPERAYAAGFRRLGIGALYGLADWRYEALSVAAHARHLLRTCWKAQVNISLPRMRPAAGGFAPKFHMSDRELVQTIAAYRLLLPHCGLVLSTREPPDLRDGLVPLGITTMSAGSSTEPGGYGAHFDETTWTPVGEQPGEQFHIADERPPQAIAAMIRGHGYEPVWKDFDQALVSEGEPAELALSPRN